MSSRGVWAADKYKIARNLKGTQFKIIYDLNNHANIFCLVRDRSQHHAHVPRAPLWGPPKSYLDVLFLFK